MDMSDGRGSGNNRARNMVNVDIRGIVTELPAEIVRIIGDIGAPSVAIYDEEYNGARVYSLRIKYAAGADMKFGMFSVESNDFSVAISAGDRWLSDAELRGAADGLRRVADGFGSRRTSIGATEIKVIDGNFSVSSGHFSAEFPHEPISNDLARALNSLADILDVSVDLL